MMWKRREAAGPWPPTSSQDGPAAELRPSAHQTRFRGAGVTGDWEAGGLYSEIGVVFFSSSGNQKQPPEPPILPND
mgnify:CR=1 FL=1